MCLAVSGKILELKESSAVVDIGNIKMKVDISLIDEAKEGDYILIHGGFGIQKVDEEYHSFLQETIDQIYYEFEGGPNA
ncbi:hydrogenase assembly chaperone HypC/HupF [Clostridium punense]|uniref:Hydrogenase assembly chaperone HypC/HupF n=1 Tax=Clostridium punense TaxID=1054297 RepID=A0ABS4K5A9_9CLOT|nr:MULTISPECIES: HypC/HybG/HupF family hydrogenase formation chaperone [Clostridium]EQB87843.1 hypothetical protein M918_07295 [Clostridium sp. BL8]MBP2022336.1 hydrogenase assembly chaperone HypC/HupF [Clostridium punense]